MMKATIPMNSIPHRLWTTSALLVVAVLASSCSVSRSRYSSSDNGRITVPERHHAMVDTDGLRTVSIEYSVQSKSLVIHRSVLQTEAVLGVTLAEIRHKDGESSEDAFLGVRLRSVFAGSAAAQAGLKVDDVILRIGDEPVSSRSRVKHLILSNGYEKALELTIRRVDTRLNLSVKPESREQTIVKVVAVEPPVLSDTSRSGGSFGRLNGESARYLLGDPDGSGVILWSIRTGTPLFWSGLRPGDIILSMGQDPVRDPEDVIDAMQLAAESGGSVTLDVRRGDRQLSETVYPEEEIGDGFNFHIPVVIHWRRRPGETDFDLGGGLVFEYDWNAHYSGGEPSTSRGWSFPLNLIEYHRSADGRRRFSLLWLINFNW